MKGQRGVVRFTQSILNRFGSFRLSSGIWYLTGFTITCTLLIGCNQIRLPKIDSNGKGLFVSGDTTEVTQPFKDTEKIRDLPTIIPKPAFRAPDPGQNSDEGLLSDSNQNAEEKTQVTAGMIWTTPKIMAAPIGSAVVLKAGLVGSKRQLLSGRKLEWTVSEGSPGIIEKAGGGNPNTFRWLFPKYGNKTTDTYAHTITSERAEVVHQDTNDYLDDIGVAKGEAWTVVSSDQKGTTEILVGASTETNWDNQYQRILVHWIDAQWQFPNSISGDAGSDQTLTTTVSRPSDNYPLSGWTVRYKLVSNRQATLSSQANNEQLDTIDVTTDEQGKASIRVSPNINQAGIVYVKTEVIRPADVSLETPSLVVGQSTVAVTWNSPGLSISSSSPKIVKLGQTIDCLVTISNPGNQTATNVVLAQTIPSGLTLDSSNPVANLTGNQAVWNIDNLAPQTERQLTVRYTAEQAGAGNLSFLVSCDEGLQSEAESLTSIVIAPLEITIEGPRIAKLGDDLQFQILLHNTSSEAISGLTLLETLGPGLIHISKSNPLGNPSVRKLAFQSRTIEPNSTTVKAISMRAIRTGTLCHTLQATLSNGLVLEKKICLEISAPIQPGTTAAPVIDAKIINNQTIQVWEAGQENTIRFQIANQSKQPITNVKIKTTLPTQLQAQLASEGHRSEGQSIMLDIPTLLPGQTRALVIQILAIQAGSNLPIRMEVTGDAISKIVKTNQSKVINNTNANPLDLSPPPVEEPMVEAEPAPPTEQPLPALKPADTPANPADQDTFPLNEPPVQPMNPTPVDTVDDSRPTAKPEHTDKPTVTTTNEDLQGLEESKASAIPTNNSEEQLEEQLEEQEVAEGEAGDAPTITSDEPNTALEESSETSDNRSDITAKVLTLNNPIAVDDENVFFVYLRNNGDSLAANIMIQAQASEHFDVISIAQKDSDADDFSNAIKHENRRVSVPTMARLAAGTSIMPYQIKVNAMKQGIGKLTVTVNAEGMEKPIEISGEVEILPAK